MRVSVYVNTARLTEVTSNLQLGPISRRLLEHDHPVYPVNLLRLLAVPGLYEARGLRRFYTTASKINTAVGVGPMNHGNMHARFGEVGRTVFDTDKRTRSSQCSA